MVMDYPCAEFGDFSFSRFGFIVRADRERERETHRITEADQSRYTHATTVGVKPGFHSNASACVSCGFRLRNARNASDCV